MKVWVVLLVLAVMCSAQEGLPMDVGVELDVEDVAMRSALDGDMTEGIHMEIIPGADVLANQVNHNVDPDGDDVAEMILDPDVLADDADQVLETRDADTPCRDAGAIPDNCFYRGHSNCKMTAQCTGFGTWQETYECAVVGDWGCVDLCHKCNTGIPTCEALVGGRDCKFLMSTSCGPGCCGVGTAIAQYRCAEGKVFCEKPCCCAHCKNKAPVGPNTGHPKDCDKYLVNPRDLREYGSMCYRSCDK